MSNLKLENTDMYRLLRTKKFQYRWGKLGHNTYAYAMTNSVKIVYHGNTIADLRLLDQGQVVQISDCGYDTPTTRARLNMILSDNAVPVTAFQNNYIQHLEWNNETSKLNLWNETSYGYSTVRSAIFAREYFQEGWKVIPG